MGVKAELRQNPTGGHVTLLKRLMVAVCAACVWTIDVSGQEVSLEYQMKAMYLAKIPSFVEWPARASSKKKTPFQLCTLGGYPFGSRLAREVGGITVSGRQIELRWVHKEEELDGCEMVFFSESEAKHYGKILEGLKGKSVLTVGETEEFLEAGGMVRIGFENDRLQMEVNLAAARNANLKMDARLLALAKRVVMERSAPGG